MTTIIYDHKNQLIACDGQVSSGNRIDSYDADKWVIRGSDVWFMSGSVADEEKAIEHLNAKDPDEPKWPISCHCLLVREGVVYRCGISDKGEPWLARVHYNDGVGSGAEWALAAMDFGKGAGEAVEYASRRDTGTGGRIMIYDIKEGAFTCYKE